LRLIDGAGRAYTRLAYAGLGGREIPM